MAWRSAFSCGAGTWFRSSLVRLSTGCCKSRGHSHYLPRTFCNAVTQTTFGRRFPCTPAYTHLPVLRLVSSAAVQDGKAGADKQPTEAEMTTPRNVKVCRRGVADALGRGWLAVLTRLQGLLSWSAGVVAVAAVLMLSGVSVASAQPLPEGDSTPVMMTAVGPSGGVQVTPVFRDGGYTPVFRDASPTEVLPPTQKLKAPYPSASELSPEELSTVNLFIENTPSVVNISNIALARNQFTMDVFRIPQGNGSGFIWDGDGHVVTNFHVIKGASEVQVALVDQSSYPAKVVGVDADKDIAVLQLDCPAAKKAELKSVSLGQSSSLFVGQKVYAIGNPFGLDHTLTQGIISGLNRELATAGPRGVPIRDVIQTDAAINPGNSGGVLLDSKGRVIGINTAIADPTGKGANTGVGFAIPMDTVRPLVDQIIKYGRVIRPVLGVTIAPPQPLRQMGLDGVLVIEVPPDGPAGKAGMLPTERDGAGRVVLGDVIIGMNGKEIKKQSDLYAVLDQCKVGDTVKVEVLRGGPGGTKKTLSITLAERGG